MNRYAIGGVWYKVVVQDAVRELSFFAALQILLDTTNALIRKMCKCCTTFDKFQAFYTVTIWRSVTLAKILFWNAHSIRMIHKGLLCASVELPDEIILVIET